MRTEANTEYSAAIEYLSHIQTIVLFSLLPSPARTLTVALSFPSPFSLSTQSSRPFSLFLSLFSPYSSPPCLDIVPEFKKNQPHALPPFLVFLQPRQALHVLGDFTPAFFSSIIFSHFAAKFHAVQRRLTTKKNQKKRKRLLTSY